VIAARRSGPRVTAPAPGRSIPSDRAPTEPRLVPIVLLGSGGRLMVPGPDGPVEARTPTHARVDLFDFIDHLVARYRRLYIVDLQGIDRNTPQLDYLQELTRDTDAWVDAGVESADGVIDILVAGARRAVVGTAHLTGPVELERSLRLSGELALEIELGEAGRVVGASAWGEDPRAAARTARRAGVAHLILSPRGGPVDWRLVGELATGGPIWIDGSFERHDAARLSPSGAAGGFFHVDDELAVFAAPPAPG
jgi:Histidine biosynthesis protein